MALEKKLGWYQSDVPRINSKAQQLLESYSGLAPDEVLPHVLSLVSLKFGSRWALLISHSAMRLSVCIIMPA
jgi:hypothetical protein